MTALTFTFDPDLFTFPDVKLPQVWTCRQRFQHGALDALTIVEKTRHAVGRLASDPRVGPGSEIAVGVGSRGLDNLALIVKTTIDTLKEHQLVPFIVPAMGSHAGAVAEGQVELLAGYGITESAMGCEIRATMEVEEIGRLESPEEFAGFPVVFDRNAVCADGILVINRMKAHTDFTGPIESGIGKMCAIGLGKQVGAAAMHRFGAPAFARIVPAVAQYLTEHLPILGGVALLENEGCRTSDIVCLPASDVGREGEVILTNRARTMLPRIPFEEIDVLVVDEMGKNISGAGMDTHVIGRPHMPTLAGDAFGGPRIRVISVLDLSEETHGNAAGIGLADIITARLLQRVDYHASFLNMYTSGEGGVYRGRIPLVQPTAEDCVRAAIALCGHASADEVRLVHIRNTRDLSTLEVSEPLLAEARSLDLLDVEETAHTLSV